MSDIEIKEMSEVEIAALGGSFEPVCFDVLYGLGLLIEDFKDRFTLPEIRQLGMVSKMINDKAGFTDF